MTRKQYTLLAEAWPVFHLPPWHRLRRRDRHRLKGLAVNELLGWRASRLLENPEVGDAVQHINPNNVMKAIMFCKGEWIFNPLPYALVHDFSGGVHRTLGELKRAAKNP